MSDIPLVTRYLPEMHIVGGIAILSGIISAIGVVFLIAMFVFFKTPRQELALTFGMLNDICVALQYLLTIPIALALYRILLEYNPALMRTATIVGVVAMLLVVGLQLLLIFGVLTFERQVIWVSLAMILGVGSWLVITGWVARSTGRLPNSLLMSILAVPYVGYPVWAFWLGQQLLGW
jgi:predicted DNA repair protein MutK